MPEHIRHLIAHCVWADRRMLRAAEANERLSADAELMRTLGHICAAEHRWLARMNGTKARVAVWPALSLEECLGLASESHGELESIAAGLTPEALARQIAYVNTAGESLQNSVEDILTHLAVHGAYHRGQLVKAIRRVGGVPPSTDYIVWVRTGGAP
jgi:uncharacterized damage-inducible protein DinB